MVIYSKSMIVYSPRYFFYRGMYLCRTLSYRGAEFEIVEAPLEAEMMVSSNFINILLYEVNLTFFS